MKKLVITLLVILLYSACQDNQAPVNEEQAEDVAQSDPLYLKDILANNPSVQIGTLQRQTLKQNIKCTGRIEIPYFEVLAVHSKSEGFVESMKFIPGDFVKKGTLLFRITNPELIEKQRILLESKAELDLALKDLERKKTLKSGEATSQKAMDEAISRKDLLTAKYTGLKSELSLLGIDLAALENEQHFQAKIPVYASNSGYIHEVLVNNGQMVSPKDRLMEIANDQHIHVELQVLSKDVPLLEKGQAVRFMLPNNGQEFSATVEKLNPMVDPESGTLNVHCHIDQGQAGQVKPGMFVNAEIEVKAREIEGLPSEAVIKEGTDYFVYVVEGEHLRKELLTNVELNNGFVSFADLAFDRMVISGAYYVE